MRTIDELPKRQGRGPKYDWDTILNGDVNVLTQGEDFDCKPSSFESQARRVAAERELTLEVRTLSDTEIALEASPRTDEDEADTVDTVEAVESTDEQAEAYA